MEDWATLLSSLIQLVAAILIYAAATSEARAKKKGTKKRSHGGKRK